MRAPQRLVSRMRTALWFALAASLLFSCSDCVPTARVEFVDAVGTELAPCQVFVRVEHPDHPGRSFRDVGGCPIAGACELPLQFGKYVVGDRLLVAVVTTDGRPLIGAASVGPASGNDMCAQSQLAEPVRLLGVDDDGFEEARGELLERRAMQ